MAPSVLTAMWAPAVRGDWGKIVLERGCNVQEGCVVRMFPGETVLLMEGAHWGMAQ